MIFTTRQAKTGFVLCMLSIALTVTTHAAVHIAEFRPALRTQYIELENDANQAVTIGGWQVDFGLPDRIGTIPAKTVIPAHQCILLATKHLSSTLSTQVRVRTDLDELVDSTLFNANLVEGYTYQLFGTSHITAQQASLGRHNSTGTACSTSLMPSTESPAATLTPTPPIAAATPTIVPTTTPTPYATSSPTSPSPTQVPTGGPTTAPTTSPAPQPTSTTPAVAPSIILSEVLVAPTSPNPEWIELYNPTSTSTVLNNWAVDDVADGGSAAQPFSVTIAAHSYQVIELKSAIFNNGGDEVRLLDGSGTQVGYTSYTKSYADESWGLDAATQEYCQKEATPGLPNTNECLHPSATPTPNVTPTTSPAPTITPSPTSPTPTLTMTPTPTSRPTAGTTPTVTPTPTTTLVNAQGVYISEFMARPPTGESEWVEFYNASAGSISLNGWYIDDVADGGSSPKRIDSLTVAAHTYAVLILPSAMLNNDTDSIRMLYSDKAPADELRYEDAESDVSFSRTHEDQPDVCKTNPTPGEENDSCLNAAENDPALTESVDPTPTVAPTPPLPAPHLAQPPIISPLTPYTGEIQGVSTYRPLATDSSSLTSVATPTQHHTSSQAALAVASIVSSCAAIVLFLKKIRPW